MPANVQAKQQIEIADGFYQSTSLPVDAQRCINWEPVIPEAEALAKRILRDPSGIKAFSVAGTQPCRGGQSMAGIPYFVNGQTLYAINSAGTDTALGYIGGSSRVSIANNGTQMVIVVPGGHGYVYNASDNTVTKITSENYQVSDTVSFKDDYFVFTASDGKQFFISDLNQPLVFLALDFSAIEFDHSPIVASHVNHNELFVMTTQTGWIYQDVGGTGFPFQVVSGANLQKGVYARSSLLEFDNTFLFVGGGLNESPSIWKVVGASSVVKISTAAIDAEIQQFNQDEISNSFSFTYSRRGNFYAAFTFQSKRIPSKTYVYDTTSSALSGRPEWHERQTTQYDNCWRVSCVVEAYGKLLCGDIIDGRIGYMDDNTYVDYDEVFRYREKVSRPYYSHQLPIFQGETQLTMESGVGGVTSPLISYSYSDDGARTYSIPTWRSYGRLGQYSTLPTWRAGGRIPRDRTIRYITTEPVKSTIIKLEAYASIGSQ